LEQDVRQTDSIKAPVDLRIVCVVVGALALFSPFVVSIETTWGQVTFAAMTWGYITSGQGGGFHFFSLMEWVLVLTIGMWRVIFVYQMIRYYRGRSTRNQTILAGILAEIPLLSFYYWGTYASSMGVLSYLVIPTPLMFVGALVFLWMTPYPVAVTHFDDQAEPDMWWQEETDSQIESPLEPQKEDDWTRGASRLRCPECGSEEIGREMHPGSFGIRARFFYSCRKCGNRWGG
jgi:predicted RNA-binding Zn-ribbon protein involved in translation (DUF1610 family)